MEQFHRKFHVSLTFFRSGCFWKVGTTQYAFLEKQDEKITGLAMATTFNKELNVCVLLCFSSNCSFKEIG